MCDKCNNYHGERERCLPFRPKTDRPRNDRPRNDHPGPRRDQYKPRVNEVNEGPEQDLISFDVEEHVDAAVEQVD